MINVNSLSSLFHAEWTNYMMFGRSCWLLVCSLLLISLLDLSFGADRYWVVLENAPLSALPSAGLVFQPLVLTVCVWSSSRLLWFLISNVCSGLRADSGCLPHFNITHPGNPSSWRSPCCASSMSLLSGLSWLCRRISCRCRTALRCYDHQSGSILSHY